MPKIDIAAVPVRRGSTYPSPYDQPCQARQRQALGDAGGLDQFGVNLMTLPPGAWTSQRHWHTAEDEFVWILQGEVVLVENEGETVLRAGDCAAFKSGVPNGHHIQNRSDQAALMLEIGTRDEARDGCDYPDLDMIIFAGDEGRCRHRDGTLY
jgi:uncharacterized cupin superfamily protein